MPQRPLQPCADPGCSALSRRRLCPKHRRARERGAERPWSFVYRTPEWRRVRRKVLEDYPYCEECGAEADTVDHIVPLRELWTEKGWKLSPYDPNNLRPLCASCSGKRTPYGRRTSR